MMAVANHGEQLQEASEELKKDEDVVTTAVNANADALRSADMPKETLRICQKRPFVIQYDSAEWKPCSWKPS